MWTPLKFNWMKTTSTKTTKTTKTESACDSRLICLRLIYLNISHRITYANTLSINVCSLLNPIHTFDASQSYGKHMHTHFALYIQGSNNNKLKPRTKITTTTTTTTNTTQAAAIATFPLERTPLAYKNT